ncbi:MAG: hypothetical protein CMJ18_11570 [Phycisphaeraceae bacterium]|nr:hypothetical protein [Phycisphaeraceae bacterium]
MSIRSFIYDVQMTVHSRSALCAFLLFTLQTPSLAAVLAQDGRTEHVIVVGADAIPLEKMAAEQLQSYLKKIIGADLPIRDDAKGPAIHVGPTDAVRRMLPDVDWASLAPAGIVIRTVGDDLVIAGGRHRGTIFAVYTFLQDFAGCRFWDTDAELVPQRPTLVCDDLDVVYRPPFRMRILSSKQFQDRTFSLKSRQSVDMEYPFGDHTIHRLLPPEKHFEAHPEWYMYAPDDDFQNDPNAEYSLANMLPQVETSNPKHAEIARRTRRIPRQPCLSSSDGRQAISDAAVAALANGSAFNPKYSDWKYPPKVLWVTQWDGRQKCECDRCTAYVAEEGSYAALWLRLANEIGERIESQFPDVLVGILSYLHTKAPPHTVVPRKNVLVYMAFLDRDHGRPVSELEPQRDHLARWGRIAPHLWVWDYNTNFRQFTKPHPNYFVQAGSIHAYHRAGVSGMLVQSFFGEAGDFLRMRYYVNAQLMWDPTKDEQKLADEFLAAYYGPAAPMLRTHIDRMNDAIRRDGGRFLSCYATTTRGWLTLDDLNEATERFERALEAVKDDETLSFRVRRARLGLEMVWLDRFRELLDASRRTGKPFHGPDDPYALVERMARNEFNVNTYRPWRPLSEYVKLKRETFPPRTGRVPEQCADLAAYEWEDIQEHQFEAVLDPALVSVVEDPKASNGKAAKLVGKLKSLQVRARVPERLAGKWRVHVVARAQALGTRAGDQSGTTMGIDLRDAPDQAVKDVRRITGSFPAIVDSDYKTFDLGVHNLGHGSTIWLRPNGQGAYGDQAGVWVDRVFLVDAR